MGRIRNTTNFEAELEHNGKKEKRESQVGPKLSLQNPTTEVVLCRGVIATVPFSLWGCHPMLSPSTVHATVMA